MLAAACRRGGRAGWRSGRRCWPGRRSRSGRPCRGRRRSRPRRGTPGRSPCCPAGPAPRALLRSRRASRRGRRRGSAPAPVRPSGRRRRSRRPSLLRRPRLPPPAAAPPWSRGRRRARRRRRWRPGRSRRCGSCCWSRSRDSRALRRSGWWRLGRFCSGGGRRRSRGLAGVVLAAAGAPDDRGDDEDHGEGRPAPINSLGRPAGRPVRPSASPSSGCGRLGLRRRRRSRLGGRRLDSLPSARAGTSALIGRFGITGETYRGLVCRGGVKFRTG